MSHKKRYQENIGHTSSASQDGYAQYAATYSNLPEVVGTAESAHTRGSLYHSEVGAMMENDIFLNYPTKNPENPYQPRIPDGGGLFPLHYPTFLYANAGEDDSFYGYHPQEMQRQHIAVECDRQKIAM